MAYDEQLADRVRDVIGLRPNASERKMFGGIAFMVGGNMACGVIGDEGERALAEPNTRPFDFTGRPMRGFVVVGPGAIGSQEDLAGWVDAGADFAAALPPR